MAISFAQASALLKNIGVAPDMELVSLVLRLMAAAQDAPDRQQFLKDAIRRALGEGGGGGGSASVRVLQGTFDD